MNVSNATPEVCPGRVLIVDDERVISLVTSRFLQREGFLTETAVEGWEALNRLLKAPFDVAVVDLQMEGMDGLAFIEEALKIRPWLRVVIQSGCVEDQAWIRAKAMGVRTMLHKPVDPSQVVQAVRDEIALQAGSADRAHRDHLEKIQIESDFLRNLTRSAITARTLREDWGKLSRRIIESFPSAGVAILMVEEGDPSLYFFLDRPVSAALLDSVRTSVCRHFAALTGRKLPDKFPLEHDGIAPQLEGAPQPGTICTVPIHDDALLGSLTVFSLEAEAYSKRDVVCLYSAANHLATLVTVFRHVQQSAVRDSLTGVYQRGHFLEEMEYVRQVALLHRWPLTAAALDVDYFKSINDIYGHSVGDQVLAELVELIKSVLKPSDLIGRTGGDEFVLVLPGTGWPELAGFSRQLMERVRSHLFCRGSLNLRLTLSVGLAVAASREETTMPCPALIELADRCLYRAKQMGRNQAFALTEKGPVPLDGDRRIVLPGPLASGLAGAEAGRLARQSVVDSFSSLLRMRGDMIGLHSRMTRDLSLILGRELGLPAEELGQLGDGAYLHDIGKFAVAERILDKKEVLHPDEWTQIQQHPDVGHQMLKAYPELQTTSEIIRSHHERHNGEGYPRGLKGEEVYLLARVVSVADVYDALRSRRPYRDSFSAAQAREMIVAQRGRQFDSQMVEAFTACADRFESAGNWDGINAGALS